MKKFWLSFVSHLGTLGVPLYLGMKGDYFGMKDFLLCLLLPFFCHTLRGWLDEGFPLCLRLVSTFLFQGVLALLQGVPFWNRGFWPPLFGLACFSLVSRLTRVSGPFPLSPIGLLSGGWPE